MATIVENFQELTPEMQKLAGVLFTADPVTGSFANMIGNFVFNLGEQLAPGETNGHAFTLSRPKGKYAGDEALRPYASRLYKLASKLETKLGAPQEIEWAVAGGKLYLLQARPITNLSAGNLDNYALNSTLAEDALWVNANIAEAIPGVVSPLTWSIVRGFDQWYGNINGKVYSNLSRKVSFIAALTGKRPAHVLKMLGEMSGPVPMEITIPIYPFRRWQLLFESLPWLARIGRKMLFSLMGMEEYLKMTPAWCRQMARRLSKVQSEVELLSIWSKEVQPYSAKAGWMLAAGSVGIVKLITLKDKLAELVGTEDANTLLSNLDRKSPLASLGPLRGIAQVAQGRMNREEYLQQYGHRGPHEFELSIPQPAEDPAWLEKQIEEFEKSPIAVEELVAKQREQYEAAKNRFALRYPRKVKWLERQITKVANGAYRREATRSEFVRVFGVARAFALRVGELTGIGEDVFFLYIWEIVQLLRGDRAVLQFIPARKENYAYYKTLPPFPSVIRGRFHPTEWLNDPQRRSDFYDSTLPVESFVSETLNGYPGATGRIEGSVRLLKSPDEGETLQQGEILVAHATNVGWTPLFPRAAAIITDIGAPLSHAVIVARELGIPAVVGTGNATTRLRTGDRVIVDGGHGIVQIL
jgi:pyruvate,water dikinase